MKYVATFYSHFGAIRFKKLCALQNLPARLAPVPRALSSSCGTCVLWEGEALLPAMLQMEELEQIAEISEEGFFTVFKAAGS